MLESLFVETTDSTGVLEIVPLLWCLFASLALGFALALLYCVKHRHTASFTVTLAVLPAVVCVVIALVNGNVGAGVAVAGAFSLVRFRSVPGTARDIGFLFLAMAVGLACGMGYVLVALLTTALVGGVYLVYQLAGFGSKGQGRDLALHVTVPEDLDYTTLFDDVFDRYLESRELTSTKTANMGSVFRLTWDIRLKANVSQKDFIDELRVRNGNLEVALTHQEVGQYEL